MTVRHTRQSLAELSDRQLIEYFADLQFSDPSPGVEAIREGLDRLVRLGLIEPYRETDMVTTTWLRAKTAARALLDAGGPGYPVAPPRDIGTDQGAIRPDIPSFRRPR